MIPSNLLIAIASCRRDRVLHDRIHAKWDCLSDIGYVRFFFGGVPGSIVLSDTWLDVPDGYFDLPLKVQAICRWALDRGYLHLFKADCDTEPFEKYFRAFDYTKYDYAGSCPSRKHYPPPHAAGFGYFLSRKAMQIVADFDASGYWAEDRMVGDALRPHITAGEIKQHNIKWMVAAPGEGNQGEPHEPKKIT